MYHSLFKIWKILLLFILHLFYKLVVFINFHKAIFPFHKLLIPLFLWPPPIFATFSLYIILGSPISPLTRGEEKENYVSSENLFHCIKFTCLDIFTVYQVCYIACLWSFRCEWSFRQVITHLTCGSLPNHRKIFTETSLKPSILCTVFCEKSRNEANSDKAEKIASLFLHSFWVPVSKKISSEETRH